jgi:adenosylcobinamide kinase/adenosylcobinamide-phosphate guanylyltransferase
MAQAGTWPGPWIYLATAAARDDEMRRKIKNHQDERGPDWRTLEAPWSPAAAVEGLTGREPLVLDCLTMWLNNLVESYAQPYSLEPVEEEAGRLMKALARYPGPAAVVSGEVGLGLVPMDPLSRFFREALGLVNQVAAARADRCFLVAAGLLLSLK